MTFLLLVTVVGMLALSITVSSMIKTVGLLASIAQLGVLVLIGVAIALAVLALQTFLSRKS